MGNLHSVKRIVAYLFFAVSIPSINASAQGVQDFLTRLAVLPDSQRQAVADSFMSAIPQFPVFDNDTTVFFFARTSAASVTVPGDANGWDIAADPMTRIAGTNLWYCRKNFEADARLDYKFYLSGPGWILDPLNPRTITGGLGPNSELRMPRYVSPPEILYYPDIPHGTLHDTTFTSTALGNSRLVRVYTPPSYDASQDSFPVILFHDGQDYIKLGQTNNIIDFLISKRLISPIIAVFVPPVNRTQEYATSQINQFSQFIAGEVMPSIDAHYRTRRDPAYRAVLGSSYGGNISLWLGYYYPTVFGNVGAQSSYILPALSQGFQSGSRLNLKLYLDLGTYDIASLIPMVRDFVPTLQSKRYAYLYHEFHEGHSWGNWRAHLGGALEYFFGNATTGAAESPSVPNELLLQQNFPNPFNPSTIISFVLPTTGRVSLKVYDIVGREVATVVGGELEGGLHQYSFNAQALAGGVYFCRLSTQTAQQTRMMLLLR